MFPNFPSLKRQPRRCIQIRSRRHPHGPHLADLKPFRPRRSHRRSHLQRCGPPLSPSRRCRPQRHYEPRSPLPASPRACVTLPLPSPAPPPLPLLPQLAIANQAALVVVDAPLPVVAVLPLHPHLHHIGFETIQELAMKLSSSIRRHIWMDLPTMLRDPMKWFLLQWVLLLKVLMLQEKLEDKDEEIQRLKNELQEKGLMEEETTEAASERDNTDVMPSENAD